LLAKRLAVATHCLTAGRKVQRVGRGSVDFEDLLDAMENSFFALPQIPGKFEHVEFSVGRGVAGVRGVWSPASPSFHSNAVGNVRLGAADADEVIEQVQEHFRSRGCAYQWFFAPTRATPDDLGARLERAGIAKAGEAAGLYVTDLEIDAEPNPDIEVYEAHGGDRMQDLLRVFTHGFPISSEVASLMVDGVIALDGRHYVAYLEGQPISAAVMFAMPDRPIAVFQGAATLPEHRGNGGYSALLHRRLRDAAAEGMEAAILQADRATSAPICAAYGFHELVDLVFHVWQPDPSPS
jgi:predicted GNAT family acetyltransferase